jgi:hypothetical protein
MGIGLLETSFESRELVQIAEWEWCNRLVPHFYKVSFVDALLVPYYPYY